MNRLIVAAIGALAASVAAPALAQEESSAALDRVYSAADQVGCDLDAYGFCAELNSSVDVWTWNNRDMLELDETSVQDIIDTDDRTTLGNVDLKTDFWFRPDERITLHGAILAGAPFAVSANNRVQGDPVHLVAASINYAPVDSEALGLDFTFGRHDWGIGVAPRGRDFVQAGAVDGVSARLDLRRGGAIDWLAFEIFGANDQTETGYYYNKPGNDPVNRFDGETNTYRMGLVYRNESLVENLGFAAYFMYATIGASGITNTGADVALGGTTGNFRDRDYLRNYGLRARYNASYSSGLMTDVYAEFALSEGVDRKAPEYVDVDLGGMMFGGGAGIGYDFGPGAFGVGGDFYAFDGASYSATGGLEFDRGFTSMRGDRVGGVTLGRLSSWRPSAVLDRGGIDHSPHDWDRQAALNFARAGLEFSYADFGLAFDFYVYTDSAESSFNFANLDQTTPPVGFSREEIDAQRRAGLSLGNEISLEARQGLTDWANLSLGFGLFNPGEYYDIEVARVASFNDDRPALGGDRTTQFWAFYGAVDFFGGVRTLAN